MNTVVIMRGISDSGKSTAAQEVAAAAQARGHSVAVCSADYYFMRDGVYVFDVTELGAAHRACWQAFVDALRRRVNVVIVDNTNTTAREWQPYAETGKNSGYDVRFQEFSPPALRADFDAYVAKCAARNTHGVPHEACLRQARRWEPRV